MGSEIVLEMSTEIIFQCIYNQYKKKYYIWYL